MAKLKVAVIGCGGIANQKHLPALSAQKDLCELVAFCDIIEERAKKYGCRLYDSDIAVCDCDTYWVKEGPILPF